MISQVNSSVVRNAYTSIMGDKTQKSSSLKGEPTISSQGDKSKVDTIKESIESGTYKMDLEALSQKIADELL